MTFISIFLLKYVFSISYSSWVVFVIGPIASELGRATIFASAFTASIVAK